MQKATEATQLAAKAAEKAANVAEDSQRQSALQFRLDERPYVVMESLVLVGDPAVGQRLTGKIVWKNTGKTPALKARISTVVALSHIEPTDMDKWLDSAKKEGLALDLGAGSSRSANTPNGTVLDQGYFDLIRTGQSKIYVAGAIVYRDIFGDEHYSTAMSVYQFGVTGADRMINTANGNEVR
jgi:hypothetical protein